jgi:hypothetical protein
MSFACEAFIDDFGLHVNEKGLCGLPCVEELGEQCLMAHGGLCTLLVHGRVEGLADLIAALADLDKGHCHLKQIIINGSLH